MDAIEIRHDSELDRMYDKLSTLEPGTEEHDKVLNEIIRAMDGKIEFKKIKDAQDGAKKDQLIKIGTFAAGLILAPLIETLCKRSLTKYIGTIEQMETFTSTPGRSMLPSFFRWKS